MPDLLDQQLAAISREFARPDRSYFVVMIDFGSIGREAIVDPALTRREVVERIRSGEYDRIHFIHHVRVSDDGAGHAIDVTNDLLSEAGFYAERANARR